MSETGLEISRLFAGFRKPVILALGGAETDRRALVNHLAGRELIGPGVGLEAGQGFQTYEDRFLTLLEGPRPGRSGAARRAYADLVLARLRAMRLKSERVNLVWYLVDSPAGRFTWLDRRLIHQMLNLGLPLALILTRVDRVGAGRLRALNRHISRWRPDLDIFEMADDPLAGTGQSASDRLINWSVEHLAAARRTAFVAGMGSAIEAKAHLGDRLAARHAAAAALAGLSPFPVPDLAFLAPNQTAMLARLALIWNLDPPPDLARLLSLGAGNLGKMLAGNLLKLLPGVGGLIGGLVNVSVAAALTWGLGKAVNIQCEKFARLARATGSASVEDFLDVDAVAPLVELYAETWEKD